MDCATLPPIIDTIEQAWEKLSPFSFRLENQVFELTLLQCQVKLANPNIIIHNRFKTEIRSDLNAEFSLTQSYKSNGKLSSDLSIQHTTQSSPATTANQDDIDIIEDLGKNIAGLFSDHNNLLLINNLQSTQDDA